MRDPVDAPLDPARYPFAHPVRVRFAETDAMGVVHHASYLPWLEEARVALLADAGRDYASVHADGMDLAVVDVRVRYRRAVRFGDPVVVRAGVALVTRSVLQIAYLLDVADEPVATATTVHACVDGSGRPVRVPDWLAELGAGPLALA